MRYRCAILDDYQQVALALADWSLLEPEVEPVVFAEAFESEEQAVAALAAFDILCVMRERTPLPGRVLERLPKLRLIVSTGPRNPSIDLEAARERGVLVCGTEGLGHPPAELTFAILLELARNVGRESGRLHAGARWQSTLGLDLCGKTLGLLGLGTVGARVARMGKGFGLEVIGWSPNLTEERCAEAGVRLVDKERLLACSDFVSLHLRLGPRSKGLIGAAELAAMKPTAFLINTARAALVEEAALLAALRARTIAGAGLDVYETEPLPTNHPFRGLPNVVLSPHLGYVTADTYRLFYGQTVEAIRAFLDGSPIRIAR